MDRSAVFDALVCRDPVEKCRLTLALMVEGAPLVIAAQQPGFVSGIPGRPDRPALIAPGDVPRRGLGSEAGRAAFLHAIAHIEFNAINLALDAAWRFPAMPGPFYADWVSVAQDEVRHFQLLTRRLQQLGYGYGDFPAHNGLWEAAEKTAHDVLVRMALVPRVLEARGLDVTPGLIRRLESVGDSESVAVLQVVLREEVRHVAIGTYWFRHLCALRGLEPDSTFLTLLADYNMRLNPPLNLPAREAAGYTLRELSAAL